jgi:SAM-dependent methyltransferase
MHAQSAGAGGNGTFGRVLDGVFRHGWLFHYARVPTYFGTARRIEEALATAPGERVLDVGCGTGMFARSTHGTYVGIDTCAAYLQFGRRRARRRPSFFVSMSVTGLGFGDGTFDKALVANLIHHLDDDAADRVLRELTRVVTRKVIVLEAAPEIATPLERFLLAHDRGDYIRDREQLRALLSRHHRVEGEDAFHNSIRTVPQVLFSLVPK